MKLHVAVSCLPIIHCLQLSSNRFPAFLHLLAPQEAIEAENAAAAARLQENEAMVSDELGVQLVGDWAAGQLRGKLRVAAVGS